MLVERAKRPGEFAATQNFGGQLSHLLIAWNTVTGKTGAITANGPVIGGVVVAADPPNSSVTDVDVIGNRVSDSFEGGVMVNAGAFNSYTKNVRVIANAVSGNDWGHLETPTKNTAGVIVFAAPGAVPPHTRAPRNIDALVASTTLRISTTGSCRRASTGPSSSGTASG